VSEYLVNGAGIEMFDHSPISKDIEQEIDDTSGYP
jgi:hypothetical protein